MSDVLPLLARFSLAIPPFPVGPLLPREPLSCPSVRTPPLAPMLSTRFAVKPDVLNRVGLD
jgi:hypothetical protein